MVPSSKYFKPKGLDSDTMVPFMLSNHNYVTKHHARGFTLYASPWNLDEHPRDHNGLRFRDYRVACMVTKKNFRKVYPRDEVFLEVDKAVVKVEKKIRWSWMAEGRKRRPVLYPGIVRGDHRSAGEKKPKQTMNKSKQQNKPRKEKKEKILKVVADEDRRIVCAADILEEWRP
ncbi:hypothetical protein FBU59_001641 [Linderina macrospora]|uniref:Uncharacterized protein n=1 Tax=Linderina macrospora TaxID=4868 RepID=A0ACC1JDN1_9FUNG|nr:hypothetical protein FBU59_001641 [Linderina macrospora]